VIEAMTELIVQSMQSWQELEFYGIGALGLVFFAAALAFVPRHPMCFASGLIFGLYAIPVVLLASTAGSVSAFLLSRYIFQSQFLRLVERYPVWKAIISAMDAEGWRLVGLIRLASPIPGAAGNYFWGLTRIRLVPYSVATLVGILPSVVLFVYLGTLGRAALQGSLGSLVQWLLMTAGLVVTAFATLLITRRARAALAEYQIGSRSSSDRPLSSK
jgi:uncharacterized membrane protein YdjX (TVP38/TMEM64 family)